MKVNRSFSLDMEDMKFIDDTAKEMNISLNEAHTILIRHGRIRLEQLDQQYSKLAPPDDPDLR